jgi:hypothetical protein
MSRIVTLMIGRKSGCRAHERTCIERYVTMEYGIGERLSARDTPTQCPGF